MNNSSKFKQFNNVYLYFVYIVAIKLHLNLLLVILRCFQLQLKAIRWR